MSLTDQEVRVLVDSIKDEDRREKFLQQLPETHPVRFEIEYSRRLIQNKKIRKWTMWLPFTIPMFLIKGVLWILFKGTWVFAWVVYQIGRLTANGCTRACWGLFPNTRKKDNP